MGLSCGVGAKFFCPICLVPVDEIMDHTKHHLMHTTQTMQTVISDARAMRLAADCDKHLQSYGLRDVDVSYNLFDVILIGALKYILNRMCFGESPILIHTVHYPGIAFMHIT
jgi:hypothetical protein